MQQNQSANSNSAMNTDFLVWRVMNAKKRKSECKRDKAYNQRPRLRSEAHH